MILGVGLDLLNSVRISKVFSKFSEKLIAKTLSNEEKNDFKKLNNDEKKINFLTKKFSIKESFVKALGIGMGRGVVFNDITVSHNEHGAPCIILSEKTQKFVENYFNINIVELKIFVSITDNHNFINTLVILEKI